MNCTYKQFFSLGKCYFFFVSSILSISTEGRFRYAWYGAYNYSPFLIWCMFLPFKAPKNPGSPPRFFYL